ncbi:MAG: glycoside hydrolase [Actinobacteria bacterium]|nr:MAG: glycoside hydrolase [Actinomycetota bacterium]
MARIKLVYLGGGSTRAAGTMASFMHHGADFDGSEVVLVDLDPDRLELIRTLAEKMAKARGLDIAVTATTDRVAALDGCDAVLSSFRPGGFAARVHDERIPLEHGTIGQETQGAGGFFMALRAIHVLKDVCAEMERVCPDAWIFNYTNPVNIVAEAVTHHSPLKIVSLCEGPIYFTHEIAESAGLDPDRLQATMVGLNHGCWSVEHSYGGADPLPLFEEAWERRSDDPSLEPQQRRQLQLAVRMGSIPADYFMYYYFRDEILAELRAKKTTRAEDILSWAPGYWRHYEEQAQLDDPQLDPALSRGGIHELELAIDVMDAIFNDKDEVHPVNMPNRGGALPGFPDDLVVELEGRCNRDGIEVLPVAAPLPRHVRGLVEMLGEYQALAAEAAWSGSREDAVRALYANPLVLNVDLAERVYAALAEAHRAYLPERLLAA